MDNGDEIPRLNDKYTFMGAAIPDWIGGFMMFILSSELFFKGAMATSMPILLLILVGTTAGLAALRAKYPDEERGIRNSFMTACGFEPPGIPAPAPLQPYWSGAPTKELSKTCEFNELKLEAIFPHQSPDEES